MRFLLQGWLLSDILLRALLIKVFFVDLLIVEVLSRGTVCQGSVGQVTLCWCFHSRSFFLHSLMFSTPINYFKNWLQENQRIKKWQWLYLISISLISQFKMCFSLSLSFSLFPLFSVPFLSPSLFIISLSPPSYHLCCFRQDTELTFCAEHCVCVCLCVCVFVRERERERERERKANGSRQNPPKCFFLCSFVCVHVRVWISLLQG